MMRMFLTLTTLTIGLIACGNLGTGHSVGETTELPAIAQDIIDADFPAGGRLHVRTKGTFQVAPEILLCEMDASVDPTLTELGITGVGIDGVKLAEAIRSLGQSDYLDGSSRQRIIRSGHCSDDGKNIIYRGYALLNRTGAPYKLVLAVWQGDPSRDGAVWVGSVERPFFAECPPGVPVTDGTCINQQYWNVPGDALALSHTFTQILTRRD